MLIALVLIAGVVGIVAGYTYSGQSLRKQAGRRRLTMDHIFNGTFRYSRPDLNWVAEGALNIILLFLALLNIYSTCMQLGMGYSHNWKGNISN